MTKNNTFGDYLRKTNLSENTIEVYLWTVKYFEEHYDEITKENLLAYKGYLMENFKPKTVNLRIQAMNKYLVYLGKESLRIKAVKVQQKNFLENVISNADYKFLKKSLKKDGIMEWYFVVWYLCATGARVSELIRIKIEHVETGYFDLYSKGGKLRRLYIPKKLRNETLWKLDTNTVTVTHFDSDTQTEESKAYNTDFIRYHLHYSDSHCPDRLRRLVNEGKIIQYLDDMERKVSEAISRQVELWKQTDSCYQKAVVADDAEKMLGLVNCFVYMAREIIFECMVYI